MFNLFRKLHHPTLAADRERAFFDLLFRVLRELANPAPPAQLAARVQHRSFANHSPNPERNFAMTLQTAPAHDAAHNSSLLMFAPLHATGGRGMSRSSLAIAMAFNVAVLVLAATWVVKPSTFVRKPPVLTYLPPVEKLPEPPRPRIIPKVVPPTPAPDLPETPTVMHRAAVQPTPPTPAPPIPHHEMPTLTVTQPAPPRIATTPPAPEVRTVKLNSSPLTVQPTGPAIANVNLNRTGSPNPGGVPGATKVSLGGPVGPSGPPSSGSPGPVHLAGCTGCPTGNSDRNWVPKPSPAPIPVPNPEPRPTPPPVPQHPVARSAPTVIFKPKALYTSEATALRIEGEVKVKIRVAADGTVTVLGVTSGLGHGLDQNAAQCAQGIRFKPAVDASGRPTDWEGVVVITFQIA